MALSLHVGTSSAARKLAILNINPNRLVMIVRLILIATVLGTISSARTEGVTSIRGYGVMSCGEYAAGYKADPQDFDDRIILQWMLGMMSGLNTAALDRHEPSRDMTSISLATQRQMFRHMCDARPLRPVFSVVMEIYRSLEVVPAIPEKQQ